MSQTAFISVSFTHRNALSNYIDAIAETLGSYNVNPLIFVDKYTFSDNDEKLMMKASCDEIARSKFVIAEASYKAVGVGVEVGYARGLNKPVIYMRHVDAEHSKTIGGIATHSIVYQSVNDLNTLLHQTIQEILAQDFQ